MPSIRRSPALALLALAAAPAAAQTTWYVAAGGSPPGSGTLANPYTSIQYAIAQPATVHGDTVLVLPGLYAELVDFSGKALEVRSSAGPSVTTIDGGMAGSVVTIPDPPAGQARFEGFRVVNGSGTPGPFGGPTLGGGILCLGSAARIADCVVELNIADEGSGVALGQGTIEDSIVRDNAAPDAKFCGGGSIQRGGGIHGGALVRDCIVQDNLSVHEGGGIFGAALVEGCTIQGNKAQFGGGVSGGTVRNSLLVGNRGESCDLSGGGGGGAHGATLEGCTLVGNLGEEFGGGAASCTLVACLVEGNRAEPTGYSYQGGGGGLYECAATDCTLRDNVVTPLPPMPPLPDSSRGGGAASSILTGCTVYGNEAELGGGVADCDAMRCTIYGNTGMGGGAYATGGGTTQLECSIVWGNSAPALHADGTVTASYSDLEGGWPGMGNIDADPRFCDGPGGDFHLKAGSPCIDAGDPLAPPDPDGSRADMGALPFDAAHCGGGCPASYCTAKTNSLGCVPLLSPSGTPSAAASTFRTGATQLVNGQAAVLVWSLAPASSSFSGGFLCVAPPLVRTPPTTTGGSPPPLDCSGQTDFHWTPAYLAAQGLGAGVTVHAQLWSRDPGDPFQTSLTQGLEFTVCP